MRPPPREEGRIIMVSIRSQCDISMPISAVPQRQLIFFRRLHFFHKFGALSLTLNVLGHLMDMNQTFGVLWRPGV